MDVSWSAAYIRRLLAQYVEDHAVDVVITFDERGVSLHAWLPTNFDTIASALPQIRAALSSVRALVRAAVNDNAQAEADRIAVTRGSGYTQAEYGWTPPSATVVTSKVGKAMAMSTPAKVAVGVGVIGLLWLMFGKKRRK
jgi:hypothetical protein